MDSWMLHATIYTSFWCLVFYCALSHLLKHHYFPTYGLFLNRLRGHLFFSFFFTLLISLVQSAKIVALYLEEDRIFFKDQMRKLYGMLGEVTLLNSLFLPVVCCVASKIIALLMIQIFNLMEKVSEKIAQLVPDIDININISF